LESPRKTTQGQEIPTTSEGDGTELALAWALLEQAADSSDSNAKAANLEAAIQHARARLADLAEAGSAGVISPPGLAVPASRDRPAALARHVPTGRRESAYCGRLWLGCRPATRSST
jgi:hypothetical protein